MKNLSPLAWRRYLASALFILLLACNPKIETTYDEAAKELVDLVDNGLAAGLKGIPLPPKEELISDLCIDDELTPTGKVQPSYEYKFPVDMLGNNVDSEEFVTNVGDIWRKNGIDVARSDTRGVVHAFGSGRGFTLEVFVNRNTNMALVAGNGPCVPKPAT